MNAPITVPLMTAEEFLALPDEPGVDRWLIRGQLRERRYEDKTMTYRNRWHSATEARIAYLLWEWLQRQSKPRGMVYSGEAGCRLHRNVDSVVGIDVMYVSAELAAQQSEKTTVIDGIPTLAVEILSPSDRTEDIEEKVGEYLRVGVPLVWVVSTRFRTVTVFRPGAEPELFNVRQEISGEPHLPGFRVPVAEIFD